MHKPWQSMRGNGGGGGIKRWVGAEGVQGRGSGGGLVRWGNQSFLCISEAYTSWVAQSSSRQIQLARRSRHRRTPQFLRQGPHLPHTTPPPPLPRRLMWLQLQDPPPPPILPSSPSAWPAGSSPPLVSFSLTVPPFSLPRLCFPQLCPPHHQPLPIPSDMPAVLTSHYISPQFIFHWPGQSMSCVCAVGKPGLAAVEGYRGHVGIATSHSRHRCFCSFAEAENKRQASGVGRRTAA